MILIWFNLWPQGNLLHCWVKASLRVVGRVCSLISCPLTRDYSAKDKLSKRQKYGILVVRHWGFRELLIWCTSFVIPDDAIYSQRSHKTSKEESSPRHHRCHFQCCPVLVQNVSSWCMYIMFICIEYGLMVPLWQVLMKTFSQKMSKAFKPQFTCSLNSVIYVI